MAQEKKNKNFVICLDMLLAKYGPTTAAIYGYIWRRSQGERKRCDANRTTIGKALHVNEKTINTHVKILLQNRYITAEERGNSSTIYRPTGKAELENDNFSVENLHTDDNSSEEILHSGVENIPSGVEIIPSSVENFPSQCGNFTHEESTEETSEENKKEKKKKEPSSSSVLSFENHQAISMWREVVKPSKIKPDDIESIITVLGSDPDKEILAQAFNEWIDRVNEAAQDGKRWSITLPSPILENYQRIGSTAVYEEVTEMVNVELSSGKIRAVETTKRVRKKSRGQRFTIYTDVNGNRMNEYGQPLDEDGYLIKPQQTRTRGRLLPDGV